MGGDLTAFELLLRRHDARVYRAVRSVLRDEAEVEDTMQQAWLQAYTHLADFRGGSAFSTWVVRIALNAALARVRGKGLGRPVPLEEVSDVMSDESHPEPGGHCGVARGSGAPRGRAVDRLPLPYRTVYVLREVEAMSTAEVARALDLEPDAVKVRLHRARLALRELLLAEAGRDAHQAFPFLAPRCDRIVAMVLGALRESPRRCLIGERAARRSLPHTRAEIRAQCSLPAGSSSASYWTRASPQVLRREGRQCTAQALRSMGSKASMSNGFGR